MRKIETLSFILNKRQIEKTKPIINFNHPHLSVWHKKMFHLRSFDFTDGMYLIEVDRVLRPGGYWILSGPPIRWKKYWRGWERTQEDLKQEQDAIEGVAKSLCWKKVIEKNDLAIWQKPNNHIECNKRKKVYKTPHICKSDNPDTAWYYHLICYHLF